MRKKRAKVLRESASNVYLKLKAEGRKMGTFKNFFRFIKRSYKIGNLRFNP